MPTGSVMELQSELKKLGDADIAAHSQRFFKTGEGEYGEGDVFLGIRVPILRSWARKHRAVSYRDAFALLKSPYHEVRLAALFLLVNLCKSKATDEQTRQKIYAEYLGNTQYINNWDLVDCSAEHIVGGYLCTRDRGVLVELAASDSLWERRIAILATFHFIRKNDFADTLRVAEMLLHDQEDLIHKAVGWMLREVGKRDFALEEAFLLKHYRQMPRTMLRYAIERFPEDVRQAYLRGER